jgi:hypothetical protein
MTNARHVDARVQVEERRSLPSLRGLERTRHRLELAAVITVVVRGDDRVDAAGKEIRAELPQPLRRPARAHARVDQDAGRRRLEEEDVSARAAGEDEDAHAASP